MPANHTQISIIIPSLNSPIIDQVLAAIDNQVMIELVTEVVVVGKDDPHLIPENGRAKLLDTGDPVPPSTARNLGINATSAELLIFLDSDCLPQPNWLREHILAHQAGHKVVGGGVLPDGENYWHLSYNLTLFHENFSTMHAGSRDYLPTLNLSIDRDVITKSGMLNESLRRGQDIEWTTRMRRAGFQPWFWPDATIYHLHNRTTMQMVWIDCARSGFYMRQIRLQHPDLLQAPKILHYRVLVLGLSPVIAGWATWRLIQKRSFMFCKQWHTIPAVYLTKIAWCWGASRPLDNSDAD